MGENSHLCNSGQVLTLTFKLNCSVGWKKLSYGTSLAGIVKFRNQFRKSCKLLPTWLKCLQPRCQRLFSLRCPFILLELLLSSRFPDTISNASSVWKLTCVEVEFSLPVSVKLEIAPKPAGDGGH